MSLKDDIVVRLVGVSKKYRLYGSKKDRVKEALFPFAGKCHRDFFAISNVDLEVRRGEVVGVVGRNGSGKSTLLKLVSGVLTPTKGEVQRKGSVVALLELGAGFNPEFSGLENIYFYSAILGYPRDVIRRKVDEIVSFAELEDFIDQPIKTYSSGMKARLAFAVSINVDPDILILDEILSVGDEMFRRKCYAKMEEFFRSGKTILYVSHNIQSVNQLCSRAVLLDRGSVILTGRPSVVTAWYEKLLFAREGQDDEVRKEILALGRRCAVPGDGPEGEGQGDGGGGCRPGSGAATANAGAQGACTEREGYLPGLQATTTVEYRNYDVDIVDVHIRSKKGERVNVLCTGKEYVYSYKVRFNDSFDDVGFGMMFKLETGMELTLANSVWFGKFLRSVVRGDECVVEWRFRCNLASGLYYTNVGVFSGLHDNKIVLNRIVDALLFKVVTPPSAGVRGFAYLEQQPEILVSAGR